MLGATGAVVSMVTLSAEDATPVLPAASLAVAVRLWAPLLSAAVTKLQAPLAFAVAVPSLVLPSNTLTVLLASAVPLSVSTVALVMPSPTTPLSGENEVMVGATGAVVSMVTLKAEDATPVLPAASVAVVVKLWLVLARVPVVKLWLVLARVPVVKLQAPLPFAVALPSSVAPS